MFLYRRVLQKRKTFTKTADHVQPDFFFLTYFMEVPEHRQSHVFEWKFNFSLSEQA